MTGIRPKVGQWSNDQNSYRLSDHVRSGYRCKEEHARIQNRETKLVEGFGDIRDLHRRGIITIIIIMSKYSEACMSIKVVDV